MENSNQRKKKYDPMFLSWAKSYDQEVRELEHLISCKPADVRLLKEELRELKRRGNCYVD